MSAETESAPNPPLVFVGDGFQVTNGTPYHIELPGSYDVGGHTIRTYCGWPRWPEGSRHNGRFCPAISWSIGNIASPREAPGLICEECIAAWEGTCQ